MHILDVKSFARFLESKKLNAFRVEAKGLQLYSREPKFAMTHQAPYVKSSAESSSNFLHGIVMAAC